MMMTKTKKTPLMTAVAFGLTSCSSSLVPKSELLHSPEDQSGFVPKHSRHGGKNIGFSSLKNLRLPISSKSTGELVPVIVQVIMFFRVFVIKYSKDSFYSCSKKKKKSNLC
jgi:hypothetical protein